MLGCALLQSHVPTGCLFVHCRSCVATKDCFWCQKQKDGTKITKPYCSSECFWGVEGKSDHETGTTPDPVLVTPDEGGLSGGALAGIVIGGIVAVIVLGILIFVCIRKANAPAPSSSSSAPSAPAHSQAYNNPAMSYDAPYPPQQPPATTPSYPNNQQLYPPDSYPTPPPAYGDVFPAAK